MKNIILILALLMIAACGSSSSSDDNSDSFEGLSESTTPNPIVSTQFFGENGNIWKPRADENSPGPGNLVILLSTQFTKRFDSCELRLNTGETAQLLCIDNQPWTQTPFSCFTNGNRQTWRADFRCSAAGEVLVTCRDFNQEVIFTVPEAQRGQVCNRFG